VEVCAGSFFIIIFLPAPVYEDFSKKPDANDDDDDDDDDELRERNHTYCLTDTVLGTGNLATVRLAFHWKTGEKVAVKVIKKDQFPEKQLLQERISSEIAVMKALNHVKEKNF
jgi:hypothetical protein